MTASVCGEMCAGCTDECAACATMACGGCGGCDSARLNRRARAATAQLELLQVTASGDAFAMDPDLADYWLHGEGAAKIRWCTKGSFRRAQNALREHIPPEQLDGAVANLYRRACGKNPGPHND